MFVVTGRKEDVTKAKKEILSAAEHFSQIRASRKNMAGTLSPPGPPTVPGHVTIQVCVKEKPPIPPPIRPTPIIIWGFFRSEYPTESSDS